MTRSLVLGALALAAVSVTRPAAAQPPPPGAVQVRPSGELRAARRHGKVKLDGRLDEAAWKEAPAYSDFVQTFPVEGVAPSERTEVRVLYDDEDLYIGVRLYDSHPDQILRSLGRRDSLPASDFVGIGIDSAHDRRTGYVFVVNAGGTLLDQLVYDDTSSTDSWDAVWEAKTRVDAAGWTAELRIPLSILRFPRASVQQWGFLVRRNLARLHETDDSIYIPRNANAFVSRWGELAGVAGIDPKRDVELSPYVAARAALRPRFSDTTRWTAAGRPRLFDASSDVGLDYKVGLTSELTLNGTVNPDFGQVEADQIILNLSNYEQFYPEKRPFFQQGLDLFQPVRPPDRGNSPQQMFYSRRMGLDTPILSAAKLTGTAAENLEVGVLDTVVSGAAQTDGSAAAMGGFDEAHPDRAVGFHLQRPLHFGPADELPLVPRVSENYFAAVARRSFSNGSAVGLTATSALPLARTCTGAMNAVTVTDPAGNDYGLPACNASGGNAAAADFNLRTPDQEWQALGQLSASQTAGGPPLVVLPDGTRLARGDAGAGGFVTAGKMGGEPWRFDVDYEYESPRLDLNASGYQRTQNNQDLRANLSYVRPNGAGPLHSYSFRLGGELSATADGRMVNRGRGFGAGADALLPGFHYVGCNVNRDAGGFNVRELVGADGYGNGVPLQTAPGWFFGCSFGTDGNLPVSIGGGGGLGYHSAGGPTRAEWGAGGGGTLTVRPHPRFTSSLDFNFDDTPWSARYVDQAPGGGYVLASLHSRYLSLTFREQLVMTPSLSLQAYAQVFSAFGRYGPFFTADPAPGASIYLSDLQPTSYDGVAAGIDFHDSAVNLNAVLRWEYRPGSVLYVVYARTSSQLPTPGDELPPATLRWGDVAHGPTIDSFLLKWSYWWNA